MIADKPADGKDFYQFVQFVKAVRVKRDYEINVGFNASFDEFQQIYLEPEKEGEKVKGATIIPALAEKSGQAV